MFVTVKTHKEIARCPFGMHIVCIYKCYIYINICYRTTRFLSGPLEVMEFQGWKMDLKVTRSYCVNTNMMEMFWTFR